MKKSNRMFQTWRISVLLLLMTLNQVGCAKPKPSNDVSNARSNDGSTVIDIGEAPERTSSPAASENQPLNLVFLIDSSGSMAEKIGEKSKMNSAKAVLGQLVGQLSADVQVGLLAYGHRVKNDCHDTELLLPIAPLNQDQFRQRVQLLQPLGQTPISYAVGKAAEALKGKAGKKVIILISDGEETCGGDPCALAHELKKADIDFQIYVVGFKIDNEAARKQLSCIAEATGGMYRDAKDAGELATGLQNALQVSAKTDQVTAGKGRLVTASLDSYGKQIGWSMEILKAGTQEKVSITHSTPPPELPPGEYDVSYYSGNDITGTVKRNVEIKAGQETRLEIEPAGRLLVKVLDQNGKEVDLVVKAHPAREDVVWVTFHTGKTQELLPGNYDLEFWGGTEFWRKGIEIKSGQETPLIITAAN